MRAKARSSIHVQGIRIRRLTVTTAQLVSTAFVIATLVAPIGVPAQNNAAPGSAAQSNSQPVPATSPAPSNAPVDHRGGYKPRGYKQRSPDAARTLPTLPGYSQRRSGFVVPAVAGIQSQRHGAARRLHQFAGNAKCVRSGNDRSRNYCRHQEGV